MIPMSSFPLFCRLPSFEICFVTLLASIMWQFFFSPTFACGRRYLSVSAVTVILRDVTDKLNAFMEKTMKFFIMSFHHIIHSFICSFPRHLWGIVDTKVTRLNDS